MKENRKFKRLKANRNTRSILVFWENKLLASPYVKKNVSCGNIRWITDIKHDVCFSRERQKFHFYRLLFSVCRRK